MTLSVRLAVTQALFCLALLISDLSPSPSLLGMHSFHISNEGGAGPGLGQHMGGNGDGNGNGVGAGGGQGGWNHHRRGHCHLGGQMSSQHWGGGGRGSGGEAEEARMTVARCTTTLQTWPPGAAAHFMWREEQIKQFTYFIRSGEGKQWWVINDYKFKDARNPTTVAAAVDGNEDDGENNSNNNNDRLTSSARSKFFFSH
jgi:hypothetical protein